MSRAGRPPKLTPEITEAVCDALRDGLSIEGACARAGISPATYYEYNKRGRDGDTRFTEFAAETARARADVERRLIESVEWAAGERIRKRALGSGDAMEIIDEAERDWRAAAWLLERKYPGEYGARQRLEHTGADGESLVQGPDLSRLSREELKDLHELMRKANGGSGGE